MSAMENSSGFSIFLSSFSAIQYNSILTKISPVLSCTLKSSIRMCRMELELGMKPLIKTRVARNAQKTTK